MTNKFITLNQQQLFFIHKQSEREAPREACGLLAGKDGVVTMVIPVNNAEPGSSRFRMDPKAQLRAMELVDIEGLEFLAIYHSHPKGKYYPSDTDVREHAYPVISVICSKVGRKWASQAFWIENGRFEEVPILSA
jgi:proteasome lid subunit RPN8/RPN11